MEIIRRVIVFSCDTNYRAFGQSHRLYERVLALPVEVPILDPYQGYDSTIGRLSREGVGGYFAAKRCKFGTNPGALLRISGAAGRTHTECHRLRGEIQRGGAAEAFGRRLRGRGSAQKRDCREGSQSPPEIHASFQSKPRQDAVARHPLNVLPRTNWHGFVVVCL